MAGAAVRIDAERFLGRLDAFAAIGATPAGGVNRQAFSPQDRRARQLLAELAVARGFSIHQDAIANLFVRREGSDASRPPLLIGSHLDSQLTGGRFDGALGTLAAFEVLEALEDAGMETAIPIEVVALTRPNMSSLTTRSMAPGCCSPRRCKGKPLIGASMTPHPTSLREATFSHKGRREGWPQRSCQSRAPAIC